MGKTRFSFLSSCIVFDIVFDLILLLCCYMATCVFGLILFIHNTAVDTLFIVCAKNVWLFQIDDYEIVLCP